MSVIEQSPDEPITTASWRVTVRQKNWVEAESKRLRIFQSEIVKKALDRAIEAQQKSEEEGSQTPEKAA